MKMLTRISSPPPAAFFFNRLELFSNTSKKSLKQIKMLHPPGGHDFHPTRTILKIVHNIIGTNLLTKFIQDYIYNNSHFCYWTQFHVFQWTGTIFELLQYIIRTNVLTNLNEYWAINVTFRVKNVPPPGDHVFY
ncbi:hypothetical protein DPMN_115983 [Dreissena polymorpha]|uniref:Uncharacterized protein n=1 Tax=Dreissena polymorpha TaxID=45954 RepID=A0A9D4KNI1_DREPO|nr:hypothetical protein DPMN_115983 [Dreissena polymorpha]